MKKTWIAALFLVVLVGALGFANAAHSQSESKNKEEKEASEVRIGLAIAPVKLDVHGKDVHLVGLGSYIVNAQAFAQIVTAAQPTRLVTTHILDSRSSSMPKTIWPGVCHLDRSPPQTLLRMRTASRRV